MRILFVQSQTEIGGAETALLALTRSLSRENVQPVVALLGFGRGPLGDQLRAQGVTVVNVPAARFRHLAAAARTIRAIARLIRDERITAVVANGGHPLLFARPAALLAQVPCIWWVHGCEPNDSLRGDFNTWAVSLLGADRFVANSAFTAKSLIRMFPEATSVDVVPPGIHLAACRPRRSRQACRAALGIAADAFAVGIFGRLQPWKGQDVFLKAAAALKRNRQGCRLLVVGGAQFGLDPEYPVKLRRLSADFGLNGDVLFLGHREDVPDLMNSCDVVVHASIAPEPWGLVLAEAMAAGVPVIATRHGGPLEMIEDGVTGMFYSPGDAAGLSVALGTLWSDPPLRRRLGRAAQTYAEKAFSAEFTAKKFAAIFENVARATLMPAAAGQSPPREIQLEVELPHPTELLPRTQPK